MHVWPRLWRVCRRLAVWYAVLRVRTTVRYPQGMPSGPVLVCAKHSSWIDVPLLADWVRKLRGDMPRFQMGSFVGYRVLRLLVPLLKRLGGFPVMRPKEVLRLRGRWDRERVKEFMQQVNARAEESRREVLRSGGALVVFPEGTRDPDRVRPLRSDLELRTAAALRPEGIDVTVWPVVLSYGSPRLGRRPVLVEFLDAFPVGDLGPGEVLDRLEACFRDRWIPPEKVEAASRHAAAREEVTS